MRATLIVLAVAAAALAAATHASARQACTAGSTGTSRTFCGPAKATLKDGGKTYTFKGGSCSTTSSTWTINIGTITLSGTPKHTYFGITVFGKKAGKYTTGTISWQMPGKRGSLYKSTVTLASGLKKGTFSGTNIIGGGTGSGSFSCG
ncbi:MAG TPA: hypothetical protein VKR79_10055 [Gaiellaceae bacterium]|nr:hypothetical protein [Gaiellaceae bacterium]